MNRREALGLLAGGALGGLLWGLPSGCSPAPSEVRAPDALAVDTMDLGSHDLGALDQTPPDPDVGAQNRSERPNIVMILTDDQGYADVGCYNAQGFKTPNLDRLATEGMRFTDFYAAAPLCTPTRAALLTGCYPVRIGLVDALNPDSKTGLNDSELTLAEALQRRGYRTGCFGKWHLGHLAPFLPTRHGFNEFFGVPHSNNVVIKKPESPTGILTYDLPLLDGETVVALNPDQSQLTTWYTERAEQFIRDHKDRPFFLYMPHSMPHAPIAVSDKFKGKSQKGLYGDVMMEIDWSVGRILQTLQELNLESNTIVMFMSDNGPAITYGSYGGSAGELREGKGSTFEGGMRVPFIARWSGRIKPGSVCRELCTVMDILPTLIQLTGAEQPKLTIDGKDIWPLLSGEGKSPHEAFFYYSLWRLDAVRSGRWKLHLPHAYMAPEQKGSGGLAGKEVQKQIELSLFNLDADPGETQNLAGQNPDTVRKLYRLIEDMRERLGDSAVKSVGKERRTSGYVAS